LHVALRAAPVAPAVVDVTTTATAAAAVAVVVVVVAVAVAVAAAPLPVLCRYLAQTAKTAIHSAAKNVRYE